MNGQPASDDAVGASTTRRQFLQTLAFGLGASALLGSRPARCWSTRSTAFPLVGRRPWSTTRSASAMCPASNRPECPQRYDAVMEALKKSSYFSALKPFQSRPATDEEILACHSAPYLARVRREIESGVKRLSTGDTWVCRKSFTAADYASGAGVRGRRRRARRPGQERLLPDAAAGTPCHGQSRHGLLRVQQRGHRRPLCTTQAPAGQGADRRLGRASRQRHARHLLRRRLGVLLQHAPVPLVSLDRPQGGDRPRQGLGHEL